MGVFMELESGKDFRLKASPRIVLPSNEHRLRVENTNTTSKQKPTYRYDLWSLERDFRENSFSPSRNSWKSIHSSSPSLEGGEVLKRGSIYQSSKSVKKMKERRAYGDRRKGEKFSFKISDTLYSLDEESSDVDQKKPPMGCHNSSLDAMSVSKSPSDLCAGHFLDFTFHSPSNIPSTGVSSDGFFEITLDLDKTDNAQKVDLESIENPKFISEPVAGPLSDSNDLEREPVLSFQKSLSAKVQVHYSPSQSDSDCSRSSPRPRFRPIRKMFDPFMKSKSHQSSLTEPDDSTPTCISSRRRQRAFRKSLLQEFSNMAPKPESHNIHSVTTDCHSRELHSPVHLHGCLKLKYRHGAPFFEFSVKSPEDAIVAKTWKADNASNWVYTFHSNRSRRKNNGNVMGLKDINRDSIMVGQMQVSCYLCSKIRDSGAPDDSLVMEFLLYDIAHARKSFSAEETSNCAPHNAITGSREFLDGGTSGLQAVSDLPKVKAQQNHAFGNADIHSSTHPWAEADLHPHLEIAAVVIEVPFQQRESMKYKKGDTISDTENPAHSISCTKMKVVTPTGNHGLPNSDGQGPSRLLDRWRLGGGCDCGGWDMGCPLMVFGNPTSEDCSPMEPMQLFVQGAKEKIPALAVKLVEEGQYAVDFHAQLSTLQAFSISVAMLHGAEASASVVQERKKELLQNVPLKVLEQEVKFLVEDVEEEKIKATKAMRKISPSFMVNPPFSPIARV